MTTLPDLYCMQMVSLDILRNQPDSYLGEHIYDEVVESIGRQAADQGVMLAHEPVLVAVVGKDAEGALLYRWAMSAEYWPPQCVVLVYTAPVSIPSSHVPH